MSWREHQNAWSFVWWNIQNLVDSSLISKNLQGQIQFCMGGKGEKGDEELASSDWVSSAVFQWSGSSTTGAFAQPACPLELAWVALGCEWVKWLCYCHHISSLWSSHPLSWKVPDYCRAWFRVMYQEQDS